MSKCNAIGDIYLCVSDCVCVCLCVCVCVCVCDRLIVLYDITLASYLMPYPVYTHTHTHTHIYIYIKCYIY